MAQEAILSDSAKPGAIETLTLLLDRRWNPGKKRRSCLLEILQDSLEKIFSSSLNRLRTRRRLSENRLGYPGGPAKASGGGESILVIDAGELSSGRRRGCRPGPDPGLFPWLAKVYHLRMPGTTLSRVRPGTATPRACGSMCTAARGIIWVRELTAWKFQSMETPRTN